MASVYPKSLCTGQFVTIILDMRLTYGSLCLDGFWKKKLIANGQDAHFALSVFGCNQQWYTWTLKHVTVYAMDIFFTLDMHTKPVSHLNAPWYLRWQRGNVIHRLMGKKAKTSLNIFICVHRRAIVPRVCDLRGLSQHKGHNQLMGFINTKLSCTHLNKLFYKI